MEFSRPEYWNGSHSLLQGIFPTQGSNPGLRHCRWILYQLSHQGSQKEIKNSNKKGSLTEWRKTFPNDVSDKELISKISKELTQLNIKKPQITQLKHWQRTRIDIFQRRHTHGPQTHEKTLNITNYHRNTNQNQNEITAHTCENDYKGCYSYGVIINFSLYVC